MIQLTAEQLERAERLLKHIPDGAEKAISRTLNRAAEAAKTEAGQQIRKQYYVSSRDVKDTIRVYRASPKSLSASFQSKGYVYALSKFKINPNVPDHRANKDKSPIIVRVKRGGRGGKLIHDFVATMPKTENQETAHTGVFARVTEGSRRVPIVTRAGKKSTKQLPIKQLYGPSVPQMLDNPAVRQPVEARASTVMNDRLDREIDWILEGHE